MSSSVAPGRTRQCLDEFSTADRLPCVLKVLAVDGSRAANELSRGSEMVILATQEADFVCLLDEGTGEEYTECDLDSLDVRFSLLGDEAALDRGKFESVGDIMTLDEHERPKYVRATQGWEGEFNFSDSVDASHTGNVDVDEVFRVGSAYSQNPNGTSCVKWEAVQLPMERPCQANNAYVRLRPAYLPMTVACGFTTQVDHGDYTLKQIVAAHRKHLLRLPVRLQVTASTVAKCKVFDKFRIQNVYKDMTLIGMKTAEPGGSVTRGKVFFRIPKADAHYVCVQEVSNWRPSMSQVVRLLLRDDDVTKASMVRKTSCLSMMDPPPLPPRGADEPPLPPRGDDDDDDDDDDDKDDDKYDYVYTLFQGHPQQHGTQNRPANQTAGMAADRPPLPSPDRVPLPLPLANMDRNAGHGRSQSTDSAKSIKLEPAPGYTLLTNADPRPAVRREPGTTRADADPAYPPRHPSSTSPLEQMVAAAVTATDGSAKPSSRLPQPRSKDLTGFYVDLSKHPAGGTRAPQSTATDEDASDYQVPRPMTDPARPYVPPRDQSPAPTPVGGPWSVRPKPRARQQLSAASSVDDIPVLPQPATYLLNTVELIDRLRQSDLGCYERVVRERNLDGEQFCQLDNEALTRQLGVSSAADLKAMLSMM